MNYVNNYSQAVTLAPGVTTLALSLGNGTYRLTLTDSATKPTRWEIVDAVVASGTATLTRAREGTSNQDWPAGSVIYNPLTAGQLAGIFTSLATRQTAVTTQQAAITSLTARVAALEGGGGTTNNVLTDEAGNVLVDGAGNTLVGV